MTYRSNLLIIYVIFKLFDGIQSKKRQIYDWSGGKVLTVKYPTKHGLK